MPPFPSAFLFNRGRLPVLVLALAMTVGHADWRDTDELSVNDADEVNALASMGNILLAGTDAEGVFRLDKGLSWTRAGSGLGNSNVFALASSGTHLFAGTYDGAYRSSDSGATWARIDTGRMTTSFRSIAMIDGILFAGSGYGKGIYRSFDRGDTWLESGTGLGYFPIVYSLGSSDSYYFAGTDGGGYRSADTGKTWTRMDGLPNAGLRDFLAKDGKLFFGTWGAGVYRSLDSGKSWSKASTGLPAYIEVLDLVQAGTDLYAAGYSAGIYRSSNDGASWTQVREGIYPRECFSLAVIGSELFAGAYGAVWKRPLSEMASVRLAFRSPHAKAGFAQGPVLQIHPGAEIAFMTEKRGRVELGIYDLNGKRIAVILDSHLDAGEHRAVLSPSDLREGCYSIRLQAGGSTHTRLALFTR